MMARTVRDIDGLATYLDLLERNKRATRKGTGVRGMAKNRASAKRAKEFERIDEEMLRYGFPLTRMQRTLGATDEEMLRGATPAHLAAGGGVGMVAEAALAGTVGGLVQRMRNPRVPRNVIPMTVYHGSPHKFDKFDSSKIGTGEGAQAFGHGIYVSESPGVAKHYQRSRNASQSLTDRMDQLRVGNEKLVDKFDIDADDETIRLIKQKSKTLPTWLRAKRDRWSRLTEDADYPFPEYARGKVAAYENLIPEAQAGNLSVDPGSAFYTVDLPDEAIARMLDWDKPLSEQPESTRKALQPLIDEMLASPINDQARNALQSGSATGQKLHDWTAGHMAFGNPSSKPPPVQAAETLRDLGVPGIRYKAGQLSGIKSDASNFVVFDDNLLRILSREGGGIDPRMLKLMGAGAGGYMVGDNVFRGGREQRPKESRVMPRPKQRTKMLRDMKPTPSAASFVRG